tara:strand:- start:48642 stop:50702 length:2061 start_codon:yes stop_codon:yes gene_type:complete
MNKVITDITSTLSEVEQEVVNTIDSIRKKRAPNTVVRIAGGWVRDKMLGQTADDIDLMVDNMSGEQFADIVASELNLRGPAVVKKNPEKTKNIESATMTVPFSGEELSLDFTQCRTEEYGDNRREVSVKPATAEEDALRRDLTIGALFYNLNTKKIEDFTGKGIKDLITGTIRTPYDDGSEEITQEKVDEVKQSFIEDPLRIFRAIRFAGKYKGDLSPLTKAALSDPEVIDACFFSERKISKDRIMKEMVKSLKGPNSNVAMRLLKETGLFKVILDDSLKGSKFEGMMEELDMEQNNSHHKYNLWGHTMAVFENLMPMLEDYSPEKKVVMLLSALTHDLGKLYRDVHAESKSTPGTTSYHGHEKASRDIVETLLKYLSFENSTIKEVANLARYHMQPHALERADGEANAATLRKFIRRMGEKSVNWIDVITLATADAYSKGVEIDQSVIERYKNLRLSLDAALASLEAQDNQDKIIPVLNGNEIMQALNVRPGPQMKEFTEFVASLRDENPNISKEEAIQRLKQEFGEDPDEITREANVRIENKKSVCCPQQHFQSSFIEASELIMNGHLVEAQSITKKLLDDYGKDPKVVRMAAINSFKILKEDATLRDNGTLQQIFSQAERELFDSVLGAHTVGLLLTIDTPTEDDVILEMAQRIGKLSPGILRTVLDGVKTTSDIKGKLEKLC